MKFKKNDKKESNSITLLLLSDSDSEMKQLKIPRYIPRAAILTLAVVVSATGFSIYNLSSTYSTLEDKYESRNELIEELQTINTAQKSEISTLQSQISEIEKKIDAINNLEKTVKDMVGIDEEEKEKIDSKTTSNSSRSLSPRSFMIMDEPKTDVSSLSSALDKSEDELNSLIKEVESKLEYLDAKPNLNPAPGRITSPFGNRRNPFNSRKSDFHTGIDIANDSGTKIVAAGSGKVTFAGYKSGYGHMIIINHGYGYSSVYAHNKKLLVKENQYVKKGENISLMGNSGSSTGTHLHFEVRVNDEPVDPQTVIGNNK